MKNDFIKKGLVVGIIILFIGSNFVSGLNIQLKNTTGPLITGRGNTLYVGGSGPGNYTTIQSALNDAVDGDTVFVYDDSSPYYEEIRIEKSINLFGENLNTVIDGMNDMISITIVADYVFINCFSIINSNHGMYVYGDTAIIRNIHFLNNFIGISLIFTKNCIISNNLFKNCGIGLELAESSNNFISQNEITGCEEGIFFCFPASDNTISNNEITKNFNGIHFYGFESEYKDYRIENTIVQYNNLIDNSIGINIFGTFKNGIIENNNFIKNTLSIYFRIFPGQRLRINANFWGRTKLLPKVIPGITLIFLYRDDSNPKNQFDVFLYIPKIILDLHPAKEPSDIGV